MNKYHRLSPAFDPQRENETRKLWTDSGLLVRAKWADNQSFSQRVDTTDFQMSVAAEQEFDQ